MYPAVIAVGRLNPPTLGHAVLVKKVKEEAKRLGARPILFVVDGEKSGLDKSKNPLTGAQREYYIRQLFPDMHVDVVSNAYQALEVLDLQGLEPRIWVAGTDRASNYRKLLVSEKLTGEVIEIDREAGEADGVTATAARKAALAGDWELFKSLMPTSATDTILADMMNKICEGSNVHVADNSKRGDSRP